MIQIGKKLKDPMKAALKLSKMGFGHVYRNPHVGAVVMKNGYVIGYGYHEYYGGNHAEINAINMALKETNDLSECIIYVTLEPCANFGKTGPCSDYIIKHKIKKVFYGILDPNHTNKGKGIARLKQNNIEVCLDSVDDEYLKINDIYFHRHTNKKPFIIAKAGMTLDLKLANREGISKWITSEESRIHSHLLRNSCDGIIIGANTALMDNPSLNVRLNNKGFLNKPLRIIIDNEYILNSSLKVFDTSISPSCLICNDKYPKHVKDDLISKGVRILEYKEKYINPLNIINDLYDKMNITSLLIEGGAMTFNNFFELNIIHKLYFYIAPKIMNDKNAIGIFDGNDIANNLNDIRKIQFDNLEKIGNDILITSYLIK